MQFVRIAVSTLALSIFASHALADPQAPVKKVLVIGIDGCRPDAMLAANAPNLHSLMSEGASSVRAQASDHTVSGPGWGSILSGVWYQKHRVVDNNFKNANFGEYPSFLTRYKTARPSGYVASVAQWEGIAHIVTGADFAANPKTGEETAAIACKVIAEKDPDIVFVHFDDVDGAGHGHGFDPKGPKYLEAIGKVDELVGKLLTTVQKRKNYANEDWLVIVTTDHGGLGKGHGQNNPECRTIFVIVNGKSAARGTIEPPPSQVDIAPTVLSHMGVPVNPDWKLDGKPVGLKQSPAASTSNVVRKKVLILGIDGCRPDAIPAAIDAHNMHALIESGAISTHCDVLGDRPTKAFTITGPGWSSALTGVWSDKHGVMDNDFKNNHLAEHPSLFHRLKQARPGATAAAFVSWRPFVDYIILPADGGQLVADGDKIGYESADREVAKAAVHCLKESDPDLVFAYFGSMDSAGHGYGFHPRSPKYTKSLEVIDEQIGRILAAMRGRPNYANEDWLIIGCTDHGGRGREHGFGKDVPEIRNGFLLLHGNSADRSSLPARTGNVDVAVTALAHLGVAIQPQWQLDGRAVGLKAASEK